MTSPQKKEDLLHIQNRSTNLGWLHKIGFVFPSVTGAITVLKKFLKMIKDYPQYFRDSSPTGKLDQVFKLLMATVLPHR